MRADDVVILQFGHNDQKERGEGKGPFLNFTENIRRHAEMIRAHEGIPVIVSPMERRAFDEHGRVRPSVAADAEAARPAANLADMHLDGEFFAGRG